MISKLEGTSQLIWSNSLMDKKTEAHGGPVTFPGSLNPLVIVLIIP